MNMSPANVNTGKAATKELKLPKVPGSKPGPVCTTTKSTILGVNSVTHNQIAQPGNCLLNLEVEPHPKPFKKEEHVCLCFVGSKEYLLYLVRL
ncbi:hypothetical protein Pfo_007171 [Paulownia fortunei]|nr:hypothetical protein Pfo_007171 [Paulownia fortunei]